MIPILLILLIAYVGVRAVTSPLWALIGLLTILLLESRLEDYFPWYNNLVIIFGMLGMAGLAYQALMAKGTRRIQFDKIQLFLLFFIIFFTVTSPTTAFASDRNWVFTYVQLTLLTIIGGNAVGNVGQLIQLMKWFIYLNTLNVILIFFDPDVGTIQPGIDIQGANAAGRYYLTAIVFLVGLLNYKYAKVISNTQALPLITILIIGTLLSQSRTILLLMVPYLLWAFVRYYKLSPMGVIALGVVGILIIQFIPQDYFIRTWKTITGEAFEGLHGTGEFNKIQNNIRLYLWQMGFEMMYDNNIFSGIGIGGYQILFPLYSKFPSLELANPHNTYLSVLFETGILGFVLFMSIILFSFHNYRKKHPHSPDLNFLREIWLTAFLIILIAGTTKHDHYNKLFFIFLGLSSFFRYMRQSYRPHIVEQ